MELTTMDTFAVMYHYVRPNQESNRKMDLKKFHRQLDFFDKKYGILTSEDWESCLNGDKKPGVLLTFDDGLSDHFQFVLPLLLEKGYYAIFYVCGRPLIDKKPLNVHVAHLLLDYFDSEFLLKKLLGDLNDLETMKQIDKIRNYTYVKQRESDFYKIFKRMVNYTRDTGLVSEILDSYYSELIDKSNSEPKIYMSAEEVRALSNLGFGIGNHTFSHFLLSNLNNSQIQSEITKCQEALLAITGKYSRDFCYPFGGRISYNNDVLKILQNSNLRSGMSVESRKISEYDFQNKWTLPRFDCNDFLQYVD